MNYRSLSICFGIDGDVEYPSDTMIRQAREQIKLWQTYYRIPDDGIRTHRFFTPSKTCPGSLLTDNYLKEILKDNNEEKPKEQLDKQKQLENLYSQISILQKLIDLMRQLKDAQRT